MQTMLIIDDKLFNEASNLVSENNPNLLVEMALTKLIKNHQSPKRTNLLDLYGAGGIREDYDYKKLRCDENNNVLG